MRLSTKDQDAIAQLYSESQKKCDEPINEVYGNKEAWGYFDDHGDSDEGNIYDRFSRIKTMVHNYGEADIDDRLEIMERIKESWKILVLLASEIEDQENEITNKKTPFSDTVMKMKEELNSLIKSVRMDNSQKYDMENPYTSDIEQLSKSKLKPDFSDRVKGSDRRGPGRFSTKYDSERSRFF